MKPATRARLKECALALICFVGFLAAVGLIASCAARAQAATTTETLVTATKAARTVLRDDRATTSAVVEAMQTLDMQISLRKRGVEAELTSSVQVLRRLQLKLEIMRDAAEVPR